MGFLGESDINELKEISKQYIDHECLNTTMLMHTLIFDIVNNSNPDVGICLSKNKYELFKRIKNYNYAHIYESKRFGIYKKYVDLILNSIYDVLLDVYDGTNTINRIQNTYGNQYRKLTRDFIDFLSKYCSSEIIVDQSREFAQKYSEIDKIYGNLSNKDDYVWAITDYISGMTDQYAISIFDELTILESS